MKNYFLALFTLTTLVIFSCKSEKEDVNTEVEITDTIASEPTEKLINYEGVYKGVFPCEKGDCKNVEMEIKLLPNHGYVYSTKRTGVDKMALKTTGVFEFEKDGTIIVLPEIADAPNGYLLEDGKIVRLDRNKNKITTADSAKFVLNKEK
jgi:hypothetical protein